jgi:hydroxymethylglutaryl-CoA synthase
VLRFREFLPLIAVSQLRSRITFPTIHSGASLESLRYIGVGTETSIDMAKPISAYVQGMLQRADRQIPETLSSFQVQHACAGGTISLMSIAALLQTGGRSDETGMVLCTDIARYEAPSTAEITQGAGAVGLLIESNPRLLEIDLSTQGFCSRDVDDFFRPLGSVTAKVKGGYSVQCYHEAMEIAFADHCKRRGRSPADVLEETDIFVFHVPFYKMAFIAAHRVLSTHLGISGADADAFLDTRGFTAAIEPTAEIGNIYTGAAYVCLAYNLENQYRVHGRSIVGKKALITSYGSGNTMTVLSGTVAAGAPEIISRWNLAEVLGTAMDLPYSRYERWVEGPYDRETFKTFLEESEIPAGSFYLSGIRDDGYREYEHRR